MLLVARLSMKMWQAESHVEHCTDFRYYAELLLLVRVKMKEEKKWLIAKLSRYLNKVRGTRDFAPLNRT